MSLISTGSISLDSTFKYVQLYIMWNVNDSEKFDKNNIKTYVM